MPTAPAIRLLVACPGCEMQFDASRRPTGSRFRCLCGRVIVVPAADPHEAAVVRCSACGGPRQENRPSCSFCSSDFTLHEQDLHTICPRCASRISDRGRFCHACGVAIAPQTLAGDKTDFACPACGAGARLASRALPGDAVTILECGGCAGLWLGGDAFRSLEQQALERQTDAGVPPARRPPARAEKPVYRPCPICSQLMHRRNYGMKSGVIMDSCAAHGVWFDDGELAAVLEWIRGGGPRRASQEKELEAEQRRRHERLFPTATAEPPRLGTGGSLLELVGPILDVLDS